VLLPLQTHANWALTPARSMLTVELLALDTHLGMVFVILDNDTLVSSTHLLYLNKYNLLKRFVPFLHPMTFSVPVFATRVKANKLYR